MTLDVTGVMIAPPVRRWPVGVAPDRLGSQKEGCAILPSRSPLGFIRLLAAGYV